MEVINMLTKSQKRNAKRKRAKERNSSLANLAVVIPSGIYHDKHFNRHLRTLEYIFNEYFGVSPEIIPVDESLIGSLVSPRQFSVLIEATVLDDASHEL